MKRSVWGQLGRFIGVALVGVGTGSLCCWLLSCTDDPTGPSGAPQEYPFYIYNFSNDIHYEYIAGKGIVDSFALPLGHKFTLSAHGRTLFVSADSAVVAVDRETLSPLHTWPGASQVVASPNGQLLAVIGDQLNIVNVSDHSIAFHDTVSLSTGRFAADSRSFYGAVWGIGVYRVRLDSAFAVRYVSLPQGVLDVILTPDERRWILLQEGAGCSWVFQVYDAHGDSLLFREILDPGYGDIELTPDGRYAFFTNPGQMIDYECNDPTYDVAVFDIGASSVIKRIASRGYYGDSAVLDTVVALAEMAVTPDGEWLLVMSWRNRFVLVDTRSLEIVKFESIGPNASWPYVFNPKCQPGR